MDGHLVEVSNISNSRESDTITIYGLLESLYYLL